MTQHPQLPRRDLVAPPTQSRRRVAQGVESRSCAAAHAWSRKVILISTMGVFAATVTLAAEDTVLIDAPRAATPVTIATPTFPENAVAPSDGVKIQVIGTVLVDGTFRPQAVSAPEGLQPFSDAVSDALKWWRFAPAIDDTKCAVKEEVFSLSVSFEGTANQPHIYMTMPKPKPEVEHPSRIFESSWSPKVDYPSKMLANDIEGHVETITRFGVDGVAESVSILSSTPPGAFDAVVLRAARRTTVKYKSPPPTEPTCGLRTYTFCIPGSGGSRPVVKYFGCKD